MTQHYKFNNGDVCYDSHGNEFVYQAAAQNGHIVCPVLEIQGGYDEPPYTEFGEPTFRTHLFPGVSTQKQHEDIVRLEKEIAAKRTELFALRVEANKIEQEGKDRVTRLKQYEALRDLDRIMNGEVTHYVIPGLCPKILAVEDAKSDYENRQLRLLACQVTINSSTKKIGWHLSRYYDGSGNGGDVIPCLSYEEAVEVVQAEIAGQWQKWATSNHNFRGYEAVEKASRAYGVDIPESYLTAAKTQKLKDAQEAVTRNAAALELAKKQLEALSDA